MGEKRGVRSQATGPNRLKHFRKCGFAKRANRQAGKRDTQLYARNDAVQITKQHFDDPGAGTSLCDQLPHA